MASLRAFLAISPPDEVRHALVEQLSGLRIPGRLVPPQNWHITLRFLGEIDDVTRERYTAAIDQSSLGRSFVLGFDHLGAFPRPTKATVIWAGASRGGERLFELAEIADLGAGDAGIPGEDRPFRPHLTLSRARPPVRAVELVEEVELDVAWRVGAVVLFRTVPGRGGVSYEALESFPLAR